MEKETPESYIWNERRILRVTLGTIVQALLKTGKVKEIGGDAGYLGGPGTFTKLETQDPSYLDFINALNPVLAQYQRLYDGPEKIYKTMKEHTEE